VLHDCQHDDHKDQLRGEEHLDEQTLGDGRPTPKSSPKIRRAWEHAAGDTRSGNTGNQLGREHH
jgi:hypothetical protein